MKNKSISKKIMKRTFYLTIMLSTLLVTACTHDKNVSSTNNTSPINEELKKEAKSIFQIKLTNERSFRSYSSSIVTYRIKANNFSIAQFNILINDSIKNRGWIFNGKENQAYIFCQGTRQLEIIPPKILIGNDVLEDGNIGTQLENEWNIMFSHTLNGTLNKCYLERK